MGAIEVLNLCFSYLCILCARDWCRGMVISNLRQPRLLVTLKQNIPTKPAHPRPAYASNLRILTTISRPHPSMASHKGAIKPLRTVMVMRLYTSSKNTPCMQTALVQRISFIRLPYLDRHGGAVAEHKYKWCYTPVQI